MIVLDEIGMLLAPTVRSNIYLQVLLQRGYKPAKVAIMSGQKQTQKPGQVSKETLHELMKMGIDQFKIDFSLSIDDLVQKYQLDCQLLLTDSINDELVENYLKNSGLKAVVYSGFGGAIVRKNIIQSGVRLIHAHSGKVPQYRGSTTIYYSILNENKCYVSSFFLDEGIDTGPLLKEKEYPKPNNGLLIDHVYDAYIRADTICEVIDDYQRKRIFDEIQSSEEQEETYFIIHPVLKHLAILSCQPDEESLKK